MKEHPSITTMTNVATTRKSKERRMRIASRQATLRARGIPPLLPKSEELAHSDLHEFLAACPAEGEGHREVVRRLNNFAAASLNIDISEGSTRTAIYHLVEKGKLFQNDGKFFNSPPRIPTPTKSTIEITFQIRSRSDSINWVNWASKALHPRDQGYDFDTHIVNIVKITTT